MSRELKNVIALLINEKHEEAAMDLHSYLTGKVRELAGITEAAEESLVKRAKAVLLKPRGSAIKDVDDEKGEDLMIAVSYDFPENAPSIKDLKDAGFKSVRKQSSDIDKNVVLYYFERSLTEAAAEKDLTKLSMSDLASGMCNAGYDECDAKSIASSFAGEKKNKFMYHVAFHDVDADDKDKSYMVTMYAMHMKGGKLVAEPNSMPRESGMTAKEAKEYVKAHAGKI